MTSTEYTRGKIQELVRLFPFVKCSYEHREQFATHYLEILPKSVFESNEQLSDYLDDLFFDFIELYPKESIAFSTDGDISRINTTDLVEVGVQYEPDECLVWNSIDMLTNVSPQVEVIGMPIESFEFDYEFAIAA